MRSYTLASLATAAAAATQIPFFLPGMGSSRAAIDPVASIVTAGPSSTVLALACPTGTGTGTSSSSSDSADDDDDDACPWGELDITVSVMRATEYAVSVPAAQVSFDCTRSGDMTCTAAIAQALTDAGMSGFTAGTDGTVTGTTVYASSEVVLQTASVTAGEEKLSASASAAQAEESETSAKGSSSEVAKETGASETETLETSKAAEKTPATKSSSAPAEATGAATRFGIQGAALLALVGAAVHVV